MSEITMSFPEETLVALKLSPEDVGLELRLAAAMKLFELGRLSSGSAAGLAGVPRPLFLQKLSGFGVPAFRLSEEELREDASRA